MQKGKTEKEYTMTQAVTNFYLFINKKYQNTEYETIKYAMETTGDDVISYSEVKGFIDENKSSQLGQQFFLDRIDIGGVNQIWNELDKTRRGFNSSATLQVSENGSLNAAEEAAFRNKIELYGQIDKAIEDAMRNLGFNSDLTVCQGHEYEVQIKKNDIYYRAADELVGTVGSANINQLQANGTLGTEAEKAVKKVAAELIKAQIIEIYQQKLGNKVPSGYSLGNNEDDLAPVLSAKIEELLNGNFNPNTIGQQIAYIIRGYMDSAGITNYGQYSTAWSGQGLNTLQKARIEQEYRTALTIDKVNSDHKFDGFTDVLKTAIDKFIDKAIEGLEDPTDNFNTLLQKAQNSLGTFQSSPQFKALQCVVNLPNDNKFIGDGKLLNGAGLNMETIAELIKNPKFKEYIKEAYNAILANPEEYGIDEDNDLANATKIRLAVTKYIKDNMDIILEKTGCVQKKEGVQTKEDQTARILCWNFTGVMNDSYYNDEDRYNYALMFVNYVLTAYAGNDYVRKALEDTELEDLPMHKDEWGPDIIKDKMDTVMAAIKAHPKPTATNNEDPNGGGGNGGSGSAVDLDKLFDYVTEPNNKGKGDWYNNDGTKATDAEVPFPRSTQSEQTYYPTRTPIFNSTGHKNWESMEKCITMVGTNFKTFSSLFESGAIAQGVAPEKASRAATALNSYFEGILKSVFSFYDDNKKYQLKSREHDIEYTDVDGSKQTETVNVASIMNTDDDMFNSMADFGDTKSESGVYIGIENSRKMNDHEYRIHVFIDMKVLAEKFNEFLGKIK